MKFKERLSDYTEQEFIEFIHEIDRANDDEPDRVLTPLLMHFRKITEHPSGIDLLYRPASEAEGQPEQIVKIVKAWRIANGKDVFKC
ncbi:bacteriocin immunity protein [Pseudomonas sp. GD03858]|uniref:bacteriocin immunity protein n=1 Tax=unclassified Pseudomonas TaxID=196821 RepID=UPI00244A37F2|nr:MULTISPECIES: bacteriocin immunity protein [unclassified Pseudomonas]MDH0648086.1 bacteriocin immunity protein [Pseudomonas sp. GD03867]MDH0665469.1 bacteriocin immunity protein [Pseudomonas sp. GD03858]